MKTNKAILCAAVALAFLPARAQKPEGDLNREMEVTREYEPSVDAASKLGSQPEKAAAYSAGRSKDNAPAAPVLFFSSVLKYA